MSALANSQILKFGEQLPLQRRLLFLTLVSS
jgi:hypothetical protein